MDLRGRSLAPREGKSRQAKRQQTEGSGLRDRLGGSKNGIGPIPSGDEIQAHDLGGSRAEFAGLETAGTPNRLRSGNHVRLLIVRDDHATHAELRALTA